MKYRLKRVSEVLKRELGDLIRRHLAFEELVTVQEVDLTPDLKQAHVFVSVLGGSEATGQNVIARLQRHRKELQTLVARRVVLKYTPHLYFKLDESIERGSRVIDILQSLDIPEDEQEEDETAPEDDLDLDFEDENENEDDEDEDDEDDETPRRRHKR